jgi:ribosomal protein S18 acetylase RimI-like enzyme
MKEASETANIDILQLLPSQWQEYKKLRLQALKSEPQAFLSPFSKEVNLQDEIWQQRLQNVGNGKSWMFFARGSDGKLVGMVGGYRDDTDLINHSVQIWGVYVDQNIRGKGIAKALMTKILTEFGKNSDINTIILEVNTDQTSAKSLYESFGFKEVLTYQHVMGDGKEHQISKMTRSAKI